jgi:nanoRNase/pAp phosphatase (c-di-AMP/oligoRNAs hydrolase)
MARPAGEWATNQQGATYPAGHELALRAAHGAQAGSVYRLTGRRVDCSLYSIGDFDVAKIASRYGGGDG